ncbi:conserved Plasmodium protein, unknown function [Plasmodium knowlesi strain H]|uniref:Uncharacterized protein n=3 Tax=Plasmodium knowlesi TaxID=5850 RepID=A0A5K1UQZ6_PLAKH|nr:conserved Plasmodium protein, unknown function [Plasmodium knowlesi strain H]OTN65028.1 Uncharacterized protein PKNOH_S120150400 [Plasmodium knowlesi]CAA9988361.1 conserved Plasmodium protein, unknown function [Plasmodium knowlesi strain H]SBO20042.1 conserved Plasmodium protein, unknown function [Plasmodium knowlesi strain H]SBO20321.1 conserved Plasmodium protein, unknown function [Plasmodium knowlesi strain H]VVS77835.1 conserved Plasmodium protein, unknown function [Plasmodium knowlesi |eukprot:XP_002259341.1 hypothetical protein, conserved in Plasmodium species [Plasmodium knowlesi strain H]
MIILSKALHFLSSQNERNVKVHRMKIPDIIKLLNRHKEIKQDDLDNINIQIINTLNDINPSKIINNIVNNNVRKKDDLKSLKKKIYFNHLLLKTGLERGNLFKAYECKEETSGSTNSQNEATAKDSEVGQVGQVGQVSGVHKNIYGRNRRRVKMIKGSQSSDSEKNTQGNEKGELNMEVLCDVPNGEHQRGREKFTSFELANNYSNFILDNILRHVCSYIYNYKILNKINQEENKGHELVSLFLMSSIFHNFFELKFGYSYIVHFLNGLKLYKIKGNINVDHLVFDLIDGYVADVEHRGDMLSEGEADPVLEKVYDVSFVIDYLSRNANRSSHQIAQGHNFCLHTFEDAKKRQTYVLNMKDKILLSYSAQESYLNHFLQILQNKYNTERMSFSSYCLLIHMYSMSNHFVVNMFSSLPLSFLKNKMDTNMSNLIILLNSCIFFLRGKSFLNTLNAFHVHVVSEGEGKLIEDNDYMQNDYVQNDYLHNVKEKIYALTEQLINYIFQNKGTLNNNHLLQLFEILSFVKYNKSLFSYIFNKMNESLCLLDKYQIFYFLNSLSNYDIVCKGAKRDISIHTYKQLQEYSPKERQRLEGYLRAHH